MCDHCFNNGKQEFSTHKEFKDLRNVLKGKIDEGSLSVTQSKSEYRHVNFEVLTCSNCHAEWGLSEPSFRWKGFFLKIDEAYAFIDRAVKGARRKALKYGTLPVLIIIIVVYFITKY